MSDVVSVSQAIDKIRADMPAGSTLQCRIELGEVQLEIIRVPRTGYGAGTLALQALTLLCDEHGLVLTGTVDPTDSPQDPSTTDLLRWYARFGFAVVGADPETEQPLIRREPGATASSRPRP